MNTMIIDSTTDEDNHGDSNDSDNAIIMYIYLYKFICASTTE